MTSPLERSPALWNRSRLDLRSEETLAQIVDRGTLDDWRELNRLAPVPEDFDRIGAEKIEVLFGDEHE